MGTDCLCFSHPWITIYGQCDIQMKINVSNSDSLFLVPLLKLSQFRITPSVERFKEYVTFAAGYVILLELDFIHVVWNTQNLF